MSRLISAEPPPPGPAASEAIPGRSREPAERGPGGLQVFLPHFLANVLAMVGIAFSVLWVVRGDRAAEQVRLDAMQGELRALRQERDRLSDLTHALAQEAHDTDVEARLVHARLEHTEARLQALGEPSRDRVAGRSRSAEVIVEIPRLAALGAASPAVTASPAGAASAAAVYAPAGLAPGVEAPAVPAVSPARETGAQALARAIGAGPFEPSEVELDIPRLNPERSQLDRDRALVAWRQVMIEAAEAECGSWRGADGRCESDVRSHLWPFGREAVDCMLSGNAIPDYVAHIRPESTPTHSIPLQNGAVILCDGALDNP